MRVNIVCLPDPASAERVAKTGPTPEAPHSRPGDLPEDVIREIIKHLTDSEALQLSTLSKTFHATFPPRPTNIACKSYRKAVSLRKRLVHGTNGAIHLVSLDIRCTGLVATDVPVICDILAEAHNLRSLTCGPLEIGSPKVRNRIQSLPHLAQLQIHKPSKSALNAMMYPQSLSSLRLIQNNGEISWSDLGRKLSGLTLLTKLALDRCPLDDPGLYGDLDVDGAGAPIPLPSVTSLEVYSTHLPIEISYFARMFPSLDTLHLEDSMFPSEDRRHPDASNRTLHKLTYLSSKESASEISWEVRHLATSVLKNSRLYLDSICTPDNLVGLCMRLPKFTLDHWNQRIEEFIPEVHILELESFQADFPNTLRFFVSSSSSSMLVCTQPAHRSLSTGRAIRKAQS